VIEAGSLEFAHARLCARWGARPDEALWRRIEVTRDLGAVLDMAHASALAPWVEGLGTHAGLHEIELALRRRWRERVDEVAAWMPPAWRGAVAWCATLVDLPLLLHLARGGAAAPWMTRDQAWRPLLDERASPDARRALLTAARADPQQLMGTWIARWRARRPAAAAPSASEQRLLQLLERHAVAFGAAGTVDGWALRRELQSRLVALMRRAMLEPAEAFVHIALAALEGERLRGELVRRAAFPRRGLVS
jgi:hypothetical protein